MKLSSIVFAAAAAVASFSTSADATAEASTMHIRIHVEHSKQGAICYKQCPSGQYCARGTDYCRGPAPNSSECFNPATSLWIPKCDPGFYCNNGKCDYAPAKQPAPAPAPAPANGDAICYQQCPSGQYCARGTNSCRGPTPNTSECFNPATSRWIAKCDPGFVCRNGKCDYAKKHHHHHHKEAEVEVKGDEICYKQCPSGQYCARGTNYCRGPAPNSSECFNPATSRWIAKCDPGFKCKNGKCDYAKKHHHHHKKEAEVEVKGDEICYKWCPSGQYCARGTNTCRAPTPNTSECFNPATSRWISKCDPGFKCKNGKCDYAKKHHHKKAEAELKGDEICYKQCPSGQYCARGTNWCRAPTPNTSECFNPATSRWIAKCDPGFKCKNGKCDYA